MFRSVSKDLFGTQCYHSEVRKLICEFEEQNQRIVCTLSNWDVKTHLNRMSRETVWGTATELVALASMLQVPVYTFTNCSSPTYSWHMYHPIQMEMLSFDNNPALKGLAKRFMEAKYHIELLHYSECHYDRVAPLDEHKSNLLSPPILTGEVCSKDETITLE